MGYLRVNNNIAGGKTAQEKGIRKPRNYIFAKKKKGLVMVSFWYIKTGCSAWESVVPFLMLMGPGYTRGQKEVVSRVN